MYVLFSPQAHETQAITFENQYSNSEKSSVWTTKGISLGFAKEVQAGEGQS